MPGKIINWVVVAGGGAVFAGAVQTGTDGVARQRWTLGGEVGPQRLLARWINPETGEPVTIDTAKAQATAGPARTLVASHASNSVLAVGEIGRIAYFYRDAYLNPDAPCADGGSIDRITWTSGDPGALEALNTVVILPDGRHATEVKAKAVRLNGIDVMGVPDKACAPGAPASGAQFLVR